MLTDQTGLLLVLKLVELEQNLVQVHLELMQEAEELQ